MFLLILLLIYILLSLILLLSNCISIFLNSIIFSILNFQYLFNFHNLILSFLIPFPLNSYNNSQYLFTLLIILFYNFIIIILFSFHNYFCPLISLLFPFFLLFLLIPFSLFIFYSNLFPFYILHILFSFFLLPIYILYFFINLFYSFQHPSSFYNHLISYLYSNQPFSSIHLIPNYFSRSFLIYLSMVL